MWLFSFGSNNPTQLSDRLSHSVDGRPAFLEGYRRVFRGWSRNWQGGTASLKKSPGDIVFGFVAKVTAADLATLDRFEGVRAGKYKRKKFTVWDAEDERERQAIAYVSLSRTFNAPTRAYLRAVADTIGSFWQGDGGKVTWRDIRVS